MPPETKRLITEYCLHHGLPALESDVNYVHVFLSAKPRWSPPQLANLLKGHTSKYLRERFPHLQRLCGKDHLWTQAYYVGTVGQVSAETVTRYIRRIRANEGFALIPIPSRRWEFPLESLNNNPGDEEGLEELSGYISTALLADLFSVHQKTVTQDVINFRAKHTRKTAAN